MFHPGMMAPWMHQQPKRKNKSPRALERIQKRTERYKNGATKKQQAKLPQTEEMDTSESPSTSKPVVKILVHASTQTDLTGDFIPSGKSSSKRRSKKRERNTHVDSKTEDSNIQSSVAGQQQITHDSSRGAPSTQPSTSTCDASSKFQQLAITNNDLIESVRTQSDEEEFLKD